MDVLDFLRDFGFLIALLALVGFLLLWAEFRGGDRDERQSNASELSGGGGGDDDRATTAMPERTPPPTAPRAPAPPRAPAAPTSGSGPIRRPGTGNGDPRRGQ